MKKSRFSKIQIVSILKEVEAGRLVKEVCREHNVSKSTHYMRHVENRLIIDLVPQDVALAE